MGGPCPCVYGYRFEKGHGTKGLGTMGMVPVPVCMGIDLRRGMGLRD